MFWFGLGALAGAITTDRVLRYVTWWFERKERLNHPLSFLSVAQLFGACDLGRTGALEELTRRLGYRPKL